MPIMVGTIVKRYESFENPCEQYTWDENYPERTKLDVCVGIILDMDNKAIYVRWVQKCIYHARGAEFNPFNLEAVDLDNLWEIGQLGN